MSFAKLISRMVKRAKPRYTLSGPGLLKSWHELFLARPARDDKGVWGDLGVQNLELHAARTCAPSRCPRRVRPRTQPGASFTGRLTRWERSLLHTESTPATKRDFLSAIDPTRSRSEYPRCCPEVPRELRGRNVGHFTGSGETSNEDPRSNKAFYRVVAVDAAGNPAGHRTMLLSRGRSSSPHR